MRDINYAMHFTNSTYIGLGTKVVGDIKVTTGVTFCHDVINTVFIKRHTVEKDVLTMYIECIEVMEN